MSHSIHHSLPTPSGLTSRQLVQMREHLAHHYAHHYRERVTYHELRDAGQQALTAVATTPTGIGEPLRLATTIYRQMKAAMVQCGHGSPQRGN